MKKLRFFLIVLIGCFLIYYTYNSKYQVSIFDSLFWVILIAAGIPLLFWTLYKDFISFKINKEFPILLPSIISLIIISIISILEFKNYRDFNKPTLLRAYYDGDINGTGIDFKLDGTYIFNSSAIGFTDYNYGTYKIEGQKFIIDQNKIDEIIESSILEVQKQNAEDSESLNAENYLIQITKQGNKIPNSTEFKVVIDNRHN